MSSSSSTETCLPSGSADGKSPSACAAKDDIAGTMAPPMIEKVCSDEAIGLAGLLRVDEAADSDNSILTNTLTYENHMLPRRGWEVMEEDGEVMLLMADDAGDYQVVDPEDILTQRVVRDSETEEHLLLQGTHVGAWQRSSFDELRMRHRSARVALTIAATAATAEVQLYVFTRPRANKQFCFWAVADFYKLLQLTTFRALSSKWIGESAPSWEKIMIQSYGASQLVFSSFESEHTAKRAVLHQHQRCLGQTSMSTLGLLTMLATWGFATSQAGGMRGETAKQASVETFECFVAACCSGSDPWTIALEVSEVWHPRWPRPKVQADGQNVLELNCVAGLLDLSPLLALARPEGNMNVAHRWCKNLKMLVGGQGLERLQLAHLIRIGIRNKTLAPLIAQILHHMSWRLEECMLCEPKGNTLDLGRVVIRWVDWRGDEDDSWNEQMQMLVSYVGHSKKAFARLSCLGCRPTKRSCATSPSPTQFC